MDDQTILNIGEMFSVTVKKVKAQLATVIALKNSN